MSVSRAKHPRWQDVLDLWSQQNVPDVEIVEYDDLLHEFGGRWRLKNAGPNTVIRFSNPIEDTARHLAVVLPTESTEVVAAYKLLAATRHDSDYSRRRVFPREIVDNIVGSRRDWWWHSARYLLPSIEKSPLSNWEVERMETWQEFVIASAKAWSLIADEYAVLKLPSDHGFDSPRYKAFVAERNRRQELEERAEFERLQKKYVVKYEVMWSAKLAGN